MRVPLGAGDTTTSYLLVFNPPADPADGHGLGWSLVAYDHGQRRWSLNLAAHGAAATADTGTAQAAATRVLADLGVTARGWDGTEPATAPTAPPDRHHTARTPTRADRTATFHPPPGAAGSCRPGRLGAASPDTAKPADALHPNPGADR